jgi:hypothetical protein
MKSIFNLFELPSVLEYQFCENHIAFSITYLIVLFVETPRKFITFITFIAVINLRGVSTNKTIICFIAMQTYKELIYNIFTELHWHI